MIKKAYFHSTNHPCPENAMNLNLLKRWYGANQWELTKELDQADFIIISTCGFSKAEEDHEINSIKQILEQKNAQCEVVLTGCLPKINKKRVDEVFGGKYVELTQMDKFNEIMGFEKKIEQLDNHFVSEDEYDTDPTIHKYFKARKKFEKYSFLPLIKVPKILYTVPSEKWFLIRASMGCTGNCSYCGIKNAHGNIKSDPIDKVVELAKYGLKKGFTEIGLTGEDQGGYGFDLGVDLADLLAQLVKLPGDFQINLRYIDPYWLIKLKDKLLPIFQSGKIKAFCVPVQSGSNKILKLMNRKYTFEQVKETVNQILKETKVQMISTNIIVGFPGETVAEYEESFRLIKDVDFGMYVAFKYEDRPGTKASLFSDKVSEQEKNLRYKLLHKAIVRKHMRPGVFW